MKLKKKFGSVGAALSTMYALRRAGVDAWVRGAVCTAIVSACGEMLITFDGWTQV